MFLGQKFISKLTILTRCDLMIGREARKVPKQALSHQYTRDGRLLLRATANKSVTVTYPKGEPCERKETPWLLFPGHSPIFIQVASFAIWKIVIPRHPPTDGFHETMRDHVLGEMNLIDLNPNQDESHNTRRIAGDMPGSDSPVYIKVAKLGKGGNGEVWRVRNASTGALFACKMFAKDPEMFKEYKEEARLLKHVDYHVSSYTLTENPADEWWNSQTSSNFSDTMKNMDSLS